MSSVTTSHYWRLQIQTEEAWQSINKLANLQDGLWWLPGSKNTIMAIRQLLLLISLATGLAALEGRLIFPAFGQYITLHPPWNYLLVTMALYGFAAIGLIMLSGDHLLLCLVEIQFINLLSWYQPRIQKSIRSWVAFLESTIKQLCCVNRHRLSSLFSRITSLWIYTADLYLRWETCGLWELASF